MSFGENGIGMLFDTVIGMTLAGRVRVVGLGVLAILGQAAALSGCGSSVGGKTPGTGGANGGAGGGSGTGGGAGAQVLWMQAACTVSRTECSGWVEDDGMGIDGTDVNCPAANLVTTSLYASICFPTPVTSTFETMLTDAQSACDTFCSASGGFQGLYPLGALASVAGSGVTCTSTAMSGYITQAVNGQCSTVSGPDTGATALVNCTLSGRACSSMMTAADGTQYCASMSPFMQTASACYDPLLTTGQAVCQHGFAFSASTDGGASVADEFPYWYIASVILEDTPSDCAAQLATFN
jgi:hypothetical protein